MTPWIERILAPLAIANQGVALVLDPDGIVDVASLDGEVAESEDWWAMRCVYERSGRRREVGSGRLVLVVRGSLANEPLPYDIERAAASILPVRLPGPPTVRTVLSELTGEERERVISAVANAVDPAAAVVACTTGVTVSSAPLSRADQLRVACRLAVRRSRPAGLIGLARRWINDPLVVGLLEDPPDAGVLQSAWEAFVGGSAPALASDFEAAAAELGQLFGASIVEPVVAAFEPPLWASVGIRKATNEERAWSLIVAMPQPFPPSDPAGWADVAEWWGSVRSLVAAGPTDLRHQAWATWAEIDEAFLPWLRSRYGTVLSSAARWPSALHRVGPFLARRLREGDAERVLLIVLDGLGHTQWVHLRERLQVTVAEAGSIFALVPTYTTVSRQAIFAADLPMTYPESLWTTQAERRRWQAFWASEGLAVTGVAYHRVKGRFPHDHIDLGAARAIGVVVNAVDDFMHTSELLGDAQLLANLDVWVANGFLDDLVERATRAGIETWITADHGNLECLPSGALSEGLAIESAGKRLLRYPNRSLRDASKAAGIIWDDIPGMPSSAEPLLFAPGRLAFTNNQLSISHGGLSIDEVIVPLVRVWA